MTAFAHTGTESFFEAAFKRVANVIRQSRVRRAQRLALVALMEMDASRLEDLGLNIGDVMDAFEAQSSPTELLEARRAQRVSWLAVTA